MTDEKKTSKIKKEDPPQEEGTFVTRKFREYNPETQQWEVNSQRFRVVRQAVPKEPPSK